MCEALLPSRFTFVRFEQEISNINRLVLAKNTMSGDLSSLVARLEAVTTRLESCASRGGGGAGEGMLQKSLLHKIYSFIFKSGHSQISFSSCFRFKWGCRGLWQGIGLSYTTCKMSIKISQRLTKAPQAFSSYLLLQIVFEMQMSKL